jgi:hypothetical protein
MKRSNSIALSRTTDKWLNGIVLAVVHDKSCKQEAKGFFPYAKSRRDDERRGVQITRT